MKINVSELIYKKFFENLLKNKDIKPETIEAVKKLYESGRIANKNELVELILAIEARHVKNQTSNS